MTLKKLIENTTAASNPSWITRWTTFTAGWWKSSPMAMRMPSATTRTLRPHAITNSTRTARFSGSAENSVLFCTSMPRSLIALILAASLSLGGAADAFGQSSRQKRKAKKPKAAPCQTGCKPETSAPNVAADTPADEAAQRELWDLARAMRNSVPGAYERLSAFAVKNTTSVWGAGARIRRQFEKPQPAIPRLAAQSAERHAAARVRLVLDGADAARAGPVRGCLESFANNSERLSKHGDAGAIARSVCADGRPARSRAGSD